MKAEGSADTTDWRKVSDWCVRVGLPHSQIYMGEDFLAQMDSLDDQMPSLGAKHSYLKSLICNKTMAADAVQEITVL